MRLPKGRGGLASQSSEESTKRLCVWQQRCVVVNVIADNCIYFMAWVAVDTLILVWYKVVTVDTRALLLSAFM